MMPPLPCPVCIICAGNGGYAQVLGLDGSGWKAFGGRLAPVKTNEKGLPLFDGIDVFASHRHFCHLFPIYPLCEEAHNEVAQRSWIRRSIRASWNLPRFPARTWGLWPPGVEEEIWQERCWNYTVWYSVPGIPSP